MSQLILALDAIKDPRDLAEVIHLAAGFAVEVHLIGDSISPRHWKVVRKLKSWRPDLAADPDRISARHWPTVQDWVKGCKQRGCRIVGTVLTNGARPWSTASHADVALLLGEESHGLGPAARELCDELWTLPLGTGGKFYTVGQAAALLLGGWMPTP